MGCVVYQPTQCAAPQITGPKQAEITASSYLNGRYELAGTYSPLPHLLVRASTGSLQNDSQGGSDSTYYRGHHYDFGLGTYWRLGSQWVVGGLGGFGLARNEAAYSAGGFLFGRPTRHRFDARYTKLFGEAYGIVQLSETFALGAAYRVTQVNFTDLTDRNLPVDLSNMTRSEPMFFLRVRPGDGPTESRPVQLQAAWGHVGHIRLRREEHQQNVRPRRARPATVPRLHHHWHHGIPAPAVPQGPNAAHQRRTLSPQPDSCTGTLKSYVGRLLPRLKKRFDRPGKQAGSGGYVYGITQVFDTGDGGTFQTISFEGTQRVAWASPA